MKISGSRLVFVVGCGGGWVAESFKLYALRESPNRPVYPKSWFCLTMTA